MYTHSDIEALLQKGIQMLNSINIPISNDICPKIDFPKAHSFYGMCCKRGTHEYRNLPTGFKFYIRFSEYALKNSEKSVMNVILHELLHTCPDCLNHQKQWQYWANKVNKAFGYNIKRCDGDATSQDSLNLRQGNPITPSKLKQIKVVCSCCGKEYVRHRESRLTLHPEIYRCGVCKGTLKRV